MRLAQSVMSIGPAAALPDPSPVKPADDQPAIDSLNPIGLWPGSSLGAFSPPGQTGDSWVEQCGDGVATLLDAGGDNGPWQYAVTGSALGVVLGGVRLVEAGRRGDAEGIRAGWFKIGVSGLGVVTASGILHAHPAFQTALEAAKAVLGSTPLPVRIAPYAFNAGQPNTAPHAGHGGPAR